MARKSTTSTSVVSWEAQMAEAANKQASSEKPSSIYQNISTRGGILSVDDAPLPNNELRCVAVVGVPENQYYDKPFNAGTPAVPACYAFGDPDAADPENDMRPHPMAKSPQHPTCDGCWANQMGSADVGKGKACKNVRRIALIPEDAASSADDLDAAEARMLRISVMSVKNWKHYIHKLTDDLKRPTWGVVTKVKVVPDPKSQFRVQFTFEELIQFGQDTYGAMQKKVTELKKSIVAPYPDMDDMLAPKGRGTPAPKGRGTPAPKGRSAAAPRKF